MRKKLFVLVAGTILMGLVVGGSTFALFTDNKSNNASFTAGNVAVEIRSDTNELVSDGDGPPLIHLTNLAPGAGQAPAPPIIIYGKVKNTGSLNMRYNLSFIRTDAMGAADNALANALQLTLERQTGPTTWRMVGTMTVNQWHGIGTSAWQPDQSPWQLAPGQENRYRMTVLFPKATGNGAQDGANILSFHVNAVQTKNNALSYCTPGTGFSTACELQEGQPVAQSVSPSPPSPSFQGHYYKLHLNNGETAVISVVPQDPDPNLLFYVLPSPVFGLEDASVNPGYTVDQVTYTADHDGWYYVYIRANAAAGPADYTLSYQVIN